MTKYKKELDTKDQNKKEILCYGINIYIIDYDVCLISKVV